MICKVEVVQKDRVLKEYELVNGETLTIGRHPTNTIHIEEPSVSRLHAYITRENDTAILSDRNTKFGTAVNGAIVKSAQLKDGDTIKIGKKHSLRVSIS
jgi:pSer/pThr/pTyr-binding forkhead associated (FHA) protein